MQSERQALSEDNAPDQAAVVIVIAVNVAINVEYRRVCCTRTDRQTHFAFSTKAEKKRTIDIFDVDSDDDDVERRLVLLQIYDLFFCKKTPHHLGSFV